MYSTALIFAGLINLRSTTLIQGFSSKSVAKSHVIRIIYIRIYIVILTHQQEMNKLNRIYIVNHTHLCSC